MKMLLKKKPKKVRVRCSFCGCEFNVKGSMWKRVNESYRYPTEEDKDEFMKFGILFPDRSDIKYKYIKCPVCEKSIRFDEEIRWTK